MIIKETNFNYYGVLLILSVLIGIAYVLYSMIKNGYRNKRILILYMLLFIACALFFGKLFTVFASGGKENIINASFSSYGGVIGIITISIIFERIIPMNNKLIKYSIISLPLIYSISKIGCFIAGCCYGIPYNGLLSVTYPNGLNIPLFPIQITETIVFFIIFIFCNKNRDKKYIIYITIIISALSKFLLDFLRYEHVNKIVSINQIFSIFIILCTIFIYFYKNKKAIFK